MKTLLKILGSLILLFVLLIASFFLWPDKKSKLDMSQPRLEVSLQNLESYISGEEAKIPGIKDGNAAEIVWANETKNQTEYSLVYLHGFSASHEEGGNVHRALASYFGMNLYLARLASHGIEGPESMRKFKGENFMRSALEAVAVGKKLGKKVILLGTSTGATVGLPILAEDPSLFAGVFYSPNIDLYNPDTDLLTKPFGLQIARMMTGSEFHSFTPPSGAEQFWTTTYPFEATVELQKLMNATMIPETFKKIKQPVQLLAYYKNEEEQDMVVSVPAMRACFRDLGTEESQKSLIEISTVTGHAMCSPFFSEDVESPLKLSKSFFEKTLGIEARPAVREMELEVGQ